jgi:hypothetical protein
MDNQELIQALLKDEVKHALKQLGIEGTLQAIDNIINPKQRDLMRKAYFDLLAERGLNFK